MTKNSLPQNPGDDRFPATRWSLVLAATGADEPAAERAFAELCQIYWFPIYCYLRSRGESRQDAEDLTQDLFAKLIRRDSLMTLDQGKGKLRAFLLSAAKNIVASSYRRDSAQKRGAGKVPISIDASLAEGHLRLEPFESTTPEAIFERAWARALLERVRGRLADAYTRAKKDQLYAAIAPHLDARAGEPPYLEVAARLGTSAGSLRVAVFRMRQKFRELLEAEILDTLADRSELRAEIDYLMNLFAS